MVVEAGDVMIEYGLRNDQSAVWYVYYPYVSTV